MKVVCRDLAICVDCVAYTANGEVFDVHGRLITVTHSWRMAKQWGADLPHLHSACPENCDGWFSWSSCDGCGSNLGGERHPAVVLAPEDDPRPDVPAPHSDPDLDGLEEWERELLASPGPVPVDDPMAGRFVLDPEPVSTLGPTTPDLCDHYRRTCSECLTLCRLCWMHKSTPEVLAEHVATDHENNPEYGCKHCGVPGGH